MILNGSQRGGASRLAAHLLKAEENEHIDQCDGAKRIGVGIRSRKLFGRSVRDRPWVKEHNLDREH